MYKKISLWFLLVIFVLCLITTNSYADKIIQTFYDSYTPYSLYAPQNTFSYPSTAYFSTSSYSSPLLAETKPSVSNQPPVSASTPKKNFNVAGQILSRQDADGDGINDTWVIDLNNDGNADVCLQSRRLNNPDTYELEEPAGSSIVVRGIQVIAEINANVAPPSQDIDYVIDSWVQIGRN